MSSIVSRKDDHIRIALLRDVEHGSTFLDKVWLVHDSLPEVRLDEIDTSIELFNKKLALPLIIGALTGGTDLAYKINRILARVAEKCQIGICVGSQRVAIERPETRKSFTVVKEEAPTALKIANIGAPQVARLDEEKLVEWCITAIDMIDADAIAVHLNPLQECLQPEGEPDYRNVLEKLRYLVKQINKPIIVKEVGFGISRETARKLASVGVAAIEVAGWGGTNFAIIEMHRADPELRELYITFTQLGIPTLMSLCETLEEFNGRIIASGGIRTGLDIAKVLALGADAASIARPFLEKALEGEECTLNFVKRLEKELRISMMMSSCRKIEDLRKVPLVFSIEVLAWLQQRRLSKCLKRVCMDKISVP